VWTHNGSDSYPIQFALKNDAAKCTAVAPNRPTMKPTIAEVLPGAIFACDENVRFTVRGKNLSGIQAAALGSIPATHFAPLPPGDGSLAEVSVRIIDRKRKVGNQNTLSLSLRTDKGVASTLVTVSHDPATCPAPVASALPPRQPRIVKITPMTFSICDTDLRFIIEGKALNRSPEVFVGTVKANIVGTPPKSGKILNVEATGVEPKKKFAGLDEVDVTVRTADGVASGQVKVLSSSCT